MLSRPAQSADRLRLLSAAVLSAGPRLWRFTSCRFRYHLGTWRGVATHVARSGRTQETMSHSDKQALRYRPLCPLRYPTGRIQQHSQVLAAIAPLSPLVVNIREYFSPRIQGVSLAFQKFRLLYEAVPVEIVRFCVANPATWQS